jgi:hypothetical protein
MMAKVAEDVAYEYQEAMAELDDAVKFAKECGSPAAVVAALNLKQKISGLHVEDRKNDRNPVAGMSHERASAALEALQLIKRAQTAKA